MNYSNTTNFSRISIDLSAYNIAAPLYSSILIIWITVINVILITVIVTSGLRQELRYKLIACCGLSDVIINLLSNPFSVDYSLKHVFNHGCFLHILVQALYAFGDLFIQLWYVTIIIAESFVRDLWARRNVVLPRLCRIILSVFVCVSPVVTAVAILPALVLTGILPEVKLIWSYEYCHLLLTTEREITLNILCYFMPILISGGLLAYTAIRFQLQKRDFDIQNRILLDPNNKSENLFVFLPSWLVVTLLALPDAVMIILYLASSINFMTQVMFDLFITTSLLDSLRLAILPVTWLLLPDVREVAKPKFASVAKRVGLSFSKPATSEDTSVTYNDLKNDDV